MSEQNASGGARSCAFKTKVGGQALIEGIMMRGPQKTCMAVRQPDGTLYTEEMENPKKHFGRIPIVRGFFGFIESMIVGYKTLMRSADLSMTEEQAAAEQTAFDRWVEKHFGEKGANLMLGLAAVLGVCLAVGLFMVLPTFLVGLLNKAVPLGGFKTLLEGLLKIAILVGYMAAVSRLPDMHRMFSYHGAEHKTIACYEAGLPLTVENVRGCRRFHPRCGTSFILIVLIVSVLVYSLLPWSGTGLRVVLKLLLLPVVMGISYELLQWCGRSDSLVARWASAPGLWLQHITTAEPDDGMIECAIAAVTPVLPEKPEEALW